MGKILRGIFIIALAVSALSGGTLYSQTNKIRAGAASAKKTSAKDPDADTGKKKAKKNEDEPARKGAGSVKQAPQRNAPKNDKPSPNRRDSSARTNARAAAAAVESSAPEDVPEIAETAPQAESAAATDATAAVDDTVGAYEEQSYAAYEESYSDTPVAAASQEYQATDVGAAVDESYAAMSQGIETYEQVQVAAPAPAATTEAVVAAAAATKFDCSDTTVDETSQEWEDFNYCMRQRCAGGDEQPPNVQCYRQTAYDNAYFECRELFEDKPKQELFSCHMKNKIIPQEKKDACKNRGGTWTSGTGKCSISIKFSRGSPCNDGATVTKVVDERGQQLMCSYDTFGLGECHKENQEAKSQAEIAKWTGMASIGLGIATSAVGIVQGIKGAKTQVENKDGSGYSSVGAAEKANMSESALKDFKFQQKAGAIQGAVGGLGSITEGAISMAKAKEMAKIKGDQFLEGRCQVPIGLKEDGVSIDYQIIREGGSVFLGW
jgi:hypothetical protein